MKVGLRFTSALHPGCYWRRLKSGLASAWERTGVQSFSVSSADPRPGGTDQNLLNGRAVRKCGYEPDAGRDVLGLHHTGPCFGRRRSRPLVEQRGVDIAGKNAARANAVRPFLGIDRL